MNKIEQVARALCKLHWPNDERWNNYIGAAKVAIKAMREPTREMMEAGEKTPMMHSWGNGGEFTTAESAGDIFNAMIDTASKE